MPSPSRIASAAIVLLIYMFASGCSRQPPDDPRRPVVAAYGDLVLATYEDTLAATHALDRALDEMIAHPSEQTLEE